MASVFRQAFGYTEEAAVESLRPVEHPADECSFQAAMALHIFFPTLAI